MPDDLENKPATRTLRSKKSVLLVSEKMDNCKVVIEKLKSDFVNTVRHAKIGRKRRRVESEDEAVIEEEEQEKEEKSTAKGMRSSSSSGHTETRTFEKEETQKPSDRTQDERRSDEVSIKKAMPAKTSPDESEFRRFPGKSESLPYPSSHGSSPKMTQHKLSSDELPEKKSRVDEAYEREREMERLKYEKEEEYLQMQKQKQRMSMFKKLENEMGGTFHKQQKTPEGSERRGNLSREEDHSSSLYS